MEESTCSETGASREGKKGPPPFVPFEEKISADLLPPREKGIISVEVFLAEAVYV